MKRTEYEVLSVLSVRLVELVKDDFLQALDFASWLCHRRCVFIYLFFFQQEVSIMLMSFGSEKQVKNYNIKTYTRDQNYVG